MTTKKCRVCGNEYTLCKDISRNPNKSFRWQEVACSPECGSKYFEQIRKSRQLSTDDVVQKTEEVSIVDSVINITNTDSEAYSLLDSSEIEDFYEDINK